MDQKLLVSHTCCVNCTRTKIRLKNALLVCSLLLNVLSLSLWVICSMSKTFSEESSTNFRDLSLTWSKKAAEEAEVAASYNCSGHGYVFVDTSIIDTEGRPYCECNACYTGRDCSQMVADCPANADGGDPMFMEPFWIRNAEASATVVPGWYRMSYGINDASQSMISKQLEAQIRALHELVGNAVTEGRYIVVGTGSMQLLNAAVNSLSPTDALNPALVVAPTPYYSGYKAQTEMFESVDFKWNGNARPWAKRKKYSNSTKFVELVASPNNPDAFLQKAVLEGENAKSIYDHAYYWPHFTAILQPADEDVMLFSLSKLTGHAGTRIGWAIVKNYDEYIRMFNYVAQNTLGVSHDAQLRATRLIKTVIAGYQEKENWQSHNHLGLESPQYADRQLIFHYAYNVMRYRWQRLEKIFSASGRFSLQDLKPNYCTFFKTITGPSPAYAWVKCEREQDRDCTAVLKSAGIIGRPAQEFGADDRFVRLSLIKRDDNFQLLERRLQALLSQNSSSESWT
eukprot:Gb_19304 [translate_table: standard]